MASGTRTLSACWLEEQAEVSERERERGHPAAQMDWARRRLPFGRHFGSMYTQRALIFVAAPLLPRASRMKLEALKHYDHLVRAVSD